MNQRVKDALLALAGGDEELVKILETRVDDVNRSVEENKLISRETSEPVEASETAATPETEQPASPAPEVPAAPEQESQLDESVAQEIFVDESIVRGITDAVLASADFQAVQESIRGLTAAIGSLLTDLAEVNSRLKASDEALELRFQKLEQDEDLKKREWINDLSVNNPRGAKVVTFRPRTDAPVTQPAEGKSRSLAEKANETLQKLN